MTTPETPTGWQMLVSLLPVIMGGIIGIAGGLSGTAFSRLLQNKQERANLRKAKLEEIVRHLFMISSWASRARRQHIYETVDDTYQPNPAEHVVALSSLYFPELLLEAKQLDLTASQYILTLMDVKGTRLAAGQDALSKAIAEKANVDLAKLARDRAMIPTSEDVTKIGAAYKVVAEACKKVVDKATKLSAEL